ncbi:MAG: hypothetical protein QOI95_4410 [Acidimicrobiaceae bacterium]|jgi:hypothetical protein
MVLDSSPQSDRTDLPRLQRRVHVGLRLGGVGTFGLRASDGHATVDLGWSPSSQPKHAAAVLATPSQRRAGHAATRITHLTITPRTGTGLHDRRHVGARYPDAQPVQSYGRRREPQPNRLTNHSVMLRTALAAEFRLGGAGSIPPSCSVHWFAGAGGVTATSTVSLGQVASSWACGSDIRDSYPRRVRTTRSQRSTGAVGRIGKPWFTRSCPQSAAPWR